MQDGSSIHCNLYNSKNRLPYVYYLRALCRNQYSHTIQSIITYNNNTL